MNEHRKGYSGPGLKGDEQITGEHADLIAMAVGSRSRDNVDTKRITWVQDNLARVFLECEDEHDFGSWAVYLPGTDGRYPDQPDFTADTWRDAVDGAITLAAGKVKEVPRKQELRDER